MITPNNPQRFINYLANAIWQRIELPIPLIGAEEEAWNQMIRAVACKQYIAGAVEASRHPVTLAVWEWACDEDRVVSRESALVADEGVKFPDNYTLNMESSAGAVLTSLKWPRSGHQK